MIIVRIWEGLGNQLFQYAYARALQLRTGEKVFIDSDRCYRAELESYRINREYTLDNFRIMLMKYHRADKLFFFLKNETFSEKIFCWLAQREHAPLRFYKEKSPEYKAELRTLHGNYYIMGWFQNERYFKEYRAQLLKDLRPKHKIAISNKLRQILKHEETVSLHIRHGDFRMNNNVLPMGYYESAIRILEKKVKSPYYIIFSDDDNWARQNFEYLENCYYMSEEKLKDYEELLVMSKCKHNIIANSSFSWWGAWLNCNEGKIVIGPRSWFLSGSIKDINIMPEGWIRV